MKIVHKKDIHVVFIIENHILQDVRMISTLKEFLELKSHSSNQNTLYYRYYTLNGDEVAPADDDLYDIWYHKN